MSPTAPGKQERRGLKDRRLDEVVDTTLPLTAASDDVEPNTDLGRLPPHRPKTELMAGRMCLLNLRSVGKWVQANKLTRSPLAALRAVLSTLLTFDIDADIDAACRKDLGITPSTVVTTVGTSRYVVLQP